MFYSFVNSLFVCEIGENMENIRKKVPFVQSYLVVFGATDSVTEN